MRMSPCGKGGGELLGKSIKKAGLPSGKIVYWELIKLQLNKIILPT